MKTIFHLASKQTVFGAMASNSSIRVVLDIPAEEYKRIYHGTIRTVFAVAVDGRTVRFPVSILRPFVTHSGIQGVFEIMFDEDNRFDRITRLP